MLETLYKIPSRIFAQQLSRAKHQVISSHQHGLMRGKGIQELIITAKSALQNSESNNKPLQMIAFDLEKAFDKTGHDVIRQSMKAHGFGEKLVEAIDNLSLTGEAL